MPVTLNFPESSMNLRTHNSACRTKEHENSPNELTIGLLNNMSDGALAATERQFVSLINAAAEDFHIRVSLFHFPEVSRSKTTERHLERCYYRIESLWDTKLDGLIVTGREPAYPSLLDEPYWNSFVKTHEWARENTSSTIWSCLAAHAAVLYQDGIQRQRSQTKYCGVFDCDRVSDHPMLMHTPATFRLPHSRWNGLPEGELTRSGYQVLTRSDDAGVDCFVKQDSSLFVYFQGHPEYESDTLLLEYRRDVGRYLNGESSAYPSIPRGYFNQQSEQGLVRIQHEAESRSHRETLALVASIASSVGALDGWKATARSLYRNWLEQICIRKTAQEQDASAAIVNRISAISEPLPNLQQEAIGGAVA
jgi:homoserine O-succinyltransferase/O-acetyltransferase